MTPHRRPHAWLIGASLLLASSTIAFAQTPVPPPPIPPAPSVAPPPDRVLARTRGRDAVRVGGAYVLGADESAQNVTAIVADVAVDGYVDDDTVVIFGDARIGASAEIDGSLIVIGGSAHIAEGARIRRDLVVVGGMLDAPPGFAVGGSHFVLDPHAFGGWFQRIVDWLTHGLLWGRLIVPGMAWIWAVVAIWLLLSLLLGLVFEPSVRASVDVLAERPLSASVVGLLVLVLIGPVFVLLAVSIVGAFVAPFVLCALALAWTMGKIAVARWVGRNLIAEDAPDSRMQAARSFLAGFGVILLAYMVPVLGLVAWTAVGLLGIGSATLAFVAAYRKENPLLPVPERLVPRPVYAAADVEAAQVEPAVTPLPPLSSGTDMTAFPRATFVERLAAGVLDLILVVIVSQVLDSVTPEDAIFVLLLGYYAAFWAWKGTTVGGIIMQLRVVRVDGAPLRFVDALVRALSSVFSAIVVGLGFLWILKDPERQAWQDKIAGTYVVKVPRNWPL
jgi:uncharacterized RDD family membrane protein YckC